MKKQRDEREKRHIEVKKSSGYDILDQSAFTTVKPWRFIPAKRRSCDVIGLLRTMKYGRIEHDALK